MFKKIKIFLMITALFAVSFVYADEPWEGEGPYSVSEYCLLEEGNSVFGGIFTEFYNGETTGCLPFVEDADDFIDFGETVYSLAGKGSVLAIGFYNRVEVYSIIDYDDKELLFSKNVYGPVYDLAIEGDVLYLAVENGVSMINLETEDYFHKHTYGTTKALRIHNNKLYVGDGQGIKKMNLDTLDIEDQRNTSGDVTKLEIMDGVIYTFEWAGLKRFNLSNLAPVSTWGWNPYNPELKAYNGTMYAFGNNSVQKVTFSGSSVVRTAMTGDRVELRNNHTVGAFTFFPDGNGIRVSFLEEQYYRPAYDVSEYMTVLGDEKINPYSVSIMMAARNNLVTEGVLQPGEVTDEDLAPTHYYVVFEPQDKEELGLLAEDTELALTETPLHYEIIESGIYYRDPQLPDDQPNYQYAVVEVGKTLPNVQFYILDYLILEPHNEEDKTPFFFIYFPLLEVEAFQITQEDFDKLMIPWKPSGKIEVWDDTLNRYVPVEGVPVGVWSMGNLVYRAITDDNGEFEVDRLFFFPRVNYEVRWVSFPGSGYDNKITINCGYEKAVASYKVTKNQQSFNWQIGDSSKKGRQWFYAHIFRAVRNYLYLGHGKYGIDPCFNNRTIHAFYKPGRAYFLRGSDITVFSGSWVNRLAGVTCSEHSDCPPTYDCVNDACFQATRREAWDIFRITTHEMAHLHHEKFRTYRKRGENRSWNNISPRIKEGWAILLDRFFTYEVYGERGNFFLYQDKSLERFYYGGGEKKYSSIFIDLVEGDFMPYYPIDPNFVFPSYVYNQRVRFWSSGDGKTRPKDEVFNLGLSIKDIKDYITPRRKFKTLRNEIAGDFSREERKIKDLFDQYEGTENVDWRPGGPIK